jgi:hypothetical protein
VPPLAVAFFPDPVAVVAKISAATISGAAASHFFVISPSLSDLER